MIPEVDTDLFNAVHEAINDVRKWDIPVEKMTLTREHYYTACTKRDFLMYHVNNPMLMKENPPDGRVGELFGIPILIGDKSKVYGKKGIRPRTSVHDNELPYVYFETNDCNYELTAEIKIDGIKYKLRRLKNNLTIVVKSRASFFGAIPKNEWTAIDTLREMITEKAFRNYLKYGFILVKGSSGKVYQVFRNRPHTKVWLNGKKVAEVCVRIKDKRIPPTDNVIAFKQLIEISEADFQKLGNYYDYSKAA